MSVYTPKSEEEPQNFDTKLSYTYDELGRLKTVKVDKRNGVSVGDNEEITTYAYDAVGSLAGVAHPNNVTTYTYDALNRLTDLRIYDSGESLLSHYQYTLAADGQRTSVTETVTGQGTTTVNWSYDALNRLIVEDYNAPGDANDYKHTYVYDLVGNRLERQVGGGDFRIGFFESDGQYIDDDGMGLENQVFEGYVGYKFHTQPHVEYEPVRRTEEVSGEPHIAGGFYERDMVDDPRLISVNEVCDRISMFGGYEMPLATWTLFEAKLKRLSSTDVYMTCTYGDTTYTDTDDTDDPNVPMPNGIDVFVIDFANPNPYYYVKFSKVD